MNQYVRAAIAKKTGIDPEAPKPKLKDLWDLIHERTGQIILTNKPRALCTWKKKIEEAANPMSKYKIIRSAQ
jgi:hypothetical protein